MNFYAIAKSSTESNIIESPVFDVPDGKESAIAVFLSEASARAYIEAAGWERDEAVAEMEASKLMDWFTQAKQDGIDFVVLDPSRSDQESGAELEVMPLDFPHLTCKRIIARTSAAS